MIINKKEPHVIYKNSYDEITKNLSAMDLKIFFVLLNQLNFEPEIKQTVERFDNNEKHFEIDITFQKVREILDNKKLQTSAIKKSLLTLSKKENILYGFWFSREGITIRFSKEFMEKLVDESEGFLVNLKEIFKYHSSNVDVYLVYLLLIKNKDKGELVIPFEEYVEMTKTTATKNVSTVIEKYLKNVVYYNEGTFDELNYEILEDEIKFTFKP